jgi:hypothetical protein
VEALGTARLTDTIPADRALSVTVPRREISDVLKDSDAMPELTLRVVAADSEPAEVGMSWERDELERLLRATDGPEVTLTFDRNQLAQALADVEAHGLRSRAAIFTVAAIGALGSGATIANAMPTGDSGPVVSPTPISGVDRTLTDASSGAGYAAVQPSAADSMVTDASSGAGYAAASSPTDSMVTDASSGAGYAAASGGSAADSIRTDVSSAGGYSAVPSTGGSGAFIDIHQPSTADLLGGAFLLAIAGASFAARRVGTARPT